MKTQAARLFPGVLVFSALFVAVWMGPADAAQAQRVTSRDPRAVAGAPTLDAMIGQMIMVGFRGTAPEDKGVRAVRRHLARGLIGGVILFGTNIKSPAQTRALNESIATAGAALPPLIAVDQEGGHVQRLSKKNGFLYTNSQQTIARKHTPEEARAIYARMAAAIADAGFNVNFGPVVDVDIQGARNPIIGKLRRSFGRDPDTVSLYARSFIGAHRSQMVLTSAKHFPGHGSSLTDSHKGFTDITRTWKPKLELAPFRDLAAGPDDADMVMVGHLYHPAFSDGRGVPSTLSTKAIAKLLRDRVGFRGVVVTDDMEMGAIRKNFAHSDAIVRAVNAGNDILLYSNTAKYNADLGPRIHAVIKAAVADGTIPRARIEQSYARIKAMKEKRLLGR